MKTKISFVIPAKNEEKNVFELYNEIVAVIKNQKLKYEMIFVDDGSVDATFDVFKKIVKRDKNVRAVKLRGNWGKSTALQAGFELSRGDLIFTLDSDLQDDPSEIPNFLEKLDEGYDLVSGWKKVRHDPAGKVIPSRILNYLVSKLTGVKIHDTNCGYKLYKREVIDSLNLYGELYRFIPVFAAKQNFKIGEIVVQHRRRKFGKSKFGIERNIKGFLDLITIIFLTTYIRRPGHFFGTAGIISFLGGFLIGLYITYIRVTTGGIGYHQPLLMFGLLLMIIGVQLISTGLIAEMITNFNQKKGRVNELIREIIPNKKSL